MLLKILAVSICFATFNVGLAAGKITGDLLERHEIATQKFVNVPYNFNSFDRINGGNR